jgi:uncharacterized membrane protein YgcG
MKKILYVVPVFLFLLSFGNLSAQEGKSYYYKSFDANITVDKDSSFTVEEKQLYSYKGEYHKGYRNIPLNGMSDITDVEVLDGETGTPLQYSSGVLDKLLPTSWNKYTYYKQNGEMIVEWYYNLANTDHLWILKYKVHGGLGFYKDHDEVYWNIFTNYDVPIESSTVYIYLPANNFVSSDIKATTYTTDATNNSHIVYKESDNALDHFTAGPFSPKQSFTIALGWPKGLIDESSFWKYWFTKNWPHLASLAVFLGTIIFLFLFWLFKEKLKKGRGTVIAEYEPPHNLPPAMAELIVTESSTPRAWSATIVDLAVRGYVKIVEEETLGFLKIVKIISASILIIFIVTVALVVFSSGGGSNYSGLFIVLIFLIIVINSLLKRSKDYKVTKLKDIGSDEKLHDYEKRFLWILFAGRESFSTSKMKSASNTEKREMYQDMVELKKKLLNELSLDESSAYEVPINGKTIFDLQYVISIIAFVLFFIVISQQETVTPYLGLVIVSIWAIITIVISTKYNPRLSQEGRIFKEEWLGFKLYLETAERYRMQNLTPEIFEKYLPYAIIFKVEKQWAKNFDSIVTGEPAWYGHAGHGTYVGGAGVAAGGVANFSASSFSTSFSSSLSSAFASSGASGASGGGGGAGGGGGGGGGGAS